jgi:hypothetical protein
MSHSNERNEPLAVTSLVLACVALIAGPFASVPAIICGHIASRRIRNSQELTGARFAAVGLIVGYIMTVISILAIAAYIFPKATSV